MATGLLVPEDASGVADIAAQAESLGYDSVWSPELWGRDVFVALTTAAEATEEIDLGTAIANVYGRSPATLAQAAATLDRVSHGRARLGLGPSTPKVVEDLHGSAFDRPARRLHETAELVEQFLTAEGRVEYDGELFSVADFPSLDADVPVYAASLGEATRRATGRTATGWLPHNVPFGRLESAFETIASAARDADRDPDAVHVAPWVPAAVSDDPEEARSLVRGHIAYYVGSGEGYRRAVAQSYPDGAEAVAEAWRDGDRDAAREAVTDEMLADLGVAGDAASARDGLDEVRSMSVVDEPLVVIPAGTDEEVRTQTIEALAPDA